GRSSRTLQSWRPMGPLSGLLKVGASAAHVHGVARVETPTPAATEVRNSLREGMRSPLSRCGATYHTATEATIHARRATCRPRSTANAARATLGGHFPRRSSKTLAGSRPRNPWYVPSHWKRVDKARDRR